MNKILLINPLFNITKVDYDSSVSVGLLSIASYLDSQGVAVEIIDAVRQSGWQDLLAAKAQDYPLVGLSVMTTQIPPALEISRMIREINPECRIVWGGSHPTFFIEQTAAHELVDVVVYGEGEITMLELARGDGLEKIDGIAYKDQGRVVVNPPRALHDVAGTALFNWDLVPRPILEGLDIIPSLTSRGCPHRCTFCINAILKNKWRCRTADQVLDDLAIIKSRPYFHGKKLRFWDENFFVNINRAKAIIKGMIDRDLNMPWETTVRANYFKPEMIDDEFLNDLKKSGCYLLSFGAESGSLPILEMIKKDITPDDIMNSARMCLRHAIVPQYSFMIGLPGEDRSDMMKTLKLIDRLVKLSSTVQILGPQAFRPYPGSTLYEECLASGWQAPDSLAAWSKLVSNQLNYLAVANFPWVKDEDKEFVDAMEAYARFGAQSLKSAMGSSIKAQWLIKLAFVLICKLRWKLKWFAWPVEYRLAKRFVTKSL